MSIIVDASPLDASRLNIQTVGDLLNHLRDEQRLVTALLIDGQSPDLSDLRQVREQPVDGSVLFVETSPPRRLAVDVLEQVALHLGETTAAATQAATLFRQGTSGDALARLSGCFTVWQQAEQSLVMVGQVLAGEQSLPPGIDLAEVMSRVAEHLRGVKEAIENRDFVLLADVLEYESPDVIDAWIATVNDLRSALD